jgi:hypothetical protein
VRQLLVFGEKTFKIEVPDDAKITFGPWSPPTRQSEAFDRPRGNATGTLRIYRGSKENIVALFAGVTGFRDLDLDYQEQVAVEEGAAIWKSDQEGYLREEKISRRKQWVEGDPPLLSPPEPPEEPLAFDPHDDPAPKPRSRRKKA